MLRSGFHTVCGLSRPVSSALLRGIPAGLSAFRLRNPLSHLKGGAADESLIRGRAFPAVTKLFTGDAPVRSLPNVTLKAASASNEFLRPLPFASSWRAIYIPALRLYAEPYPLTDAGCKPCRWNEDYSLPLYPSTRFGDFFNVSPARGIRLESPSKSAQFLAFNLPSNLFGSNTRSDLVKTRR